MNRPETHQSPHSHPSNRRGRLFGLVTWLGINIVTLVFMLIIVVGQYQIYPKLEKMESKIAELERRLLLLERPSRSLQSNPTQQPCGVEIPIRLEPQSTAANEYKAHTPKRPDATRPLEQPLTTQ